VGPAGETPALDLEINPVGQHGRIVEFDLGAVPAEIAHGAGKSRIARVERDDSAVIDAVSGMLTPLQHDLSSMQLTIW
jgi:hypothetical protein